MAAKIRDPSPLLAIEFCQWHTQVGAAEERRSRIVASAHYRFWHRADFQPACTRQVAPGGLADRAPFSAAPVQEDHLPEDEGAGAGAQPIGAVGFEYQ